MYRIATEGATFADAVKVEENVSEPPSPDSPQHPVRHDALVLISIEPARLTEVRQSLDSTPGVAVHHLDPATGRCVAVLESADRTEGERLFDAVGRLPYVRSVEFVDATPSRASRLPAP